MSLWDQLTTAELETMKTDLLAAIHATLTKGQAVSAEDRALRRTELSELRASLKEVLQALDRKSNSGIQFSHVVPHV